MNILKRSALILLFFLIIIVIVSLFLPSSFHLERSVVIDADKEQIFKQVNDLRNWKNWSPWELKDPSMYIGDGLFSNPSSGEGASFNWDSENDEIGKGRIEIIISTTNKYIENKLDFGAGEAVGTWNFNENENGVEVVWGMDVEFGFDPISKFFGLFLEGEVSPYYELGLERLKTFSEELPKINSVKVERIAINQQWYLSIRDSVSPIEMYNVHGKMYAEIGQFMTENDILVADVPLVVYHFWSDSIIDIEAGIPIKDSVGIKHEKIKLSFIRAGDVVKAIHYGPFDRLIETYDGINEWMRKNKVRVTGPPWESYLVDPATEPNPKKWETAIYFPIE